MSEWQPIETAPKGAMHLLLYVPSLGRWPVKQGSWLPMWEFWTYYGANGKRSLEENQPTHWMPLPAPPVVEGEE